MAFIDVDEFLMLRDGTPDMPALLRDYEQYGGLAVNWIMFGSSGLKVSKGWMGRAGGRADGGSCLVVRA